MKKKVTIISIVKSDNFIGVFRTINVVYTWFFVKDRNMYVFIIEV